MKKKCNSTLRKDAYCHFRHVIGSTTRWCVLFFCFFLFIISAFFLRLQQSPIHLDDYTHHIENLVSSEGLGIRITKPFLMVDKSRGFAPQLKAESLNISLKGNSYKFENIALHFDATSLLKLNFRPYAITAEETDFLTSLQNDNNNQFSLKNLYNQQFKRGFLSHLQQLKIQNTSLTLQGDKTYFDTVKLHHGTLELRHDVDKKSIILRALGRVETDYFTQNALLETTYDIQKGLITTGINLENLDATTYNILGFRGKADVKIRISQNEEFELLNATLHAKSSGGQFNFINKTAYPEVKVRKMDISARYFLRDKKAIIQIHHLNTNHGFAKGSVIAKQNSHNKIHLAFLGKLHGFNYAEMFEYPVTFEKIHLEGSLNKKTQQANFNKLRIYTEKAHISGSVTVTETKPTAFNVASKLKIYGITEKNLTKLWPIKTPGQARAWLKANLLRTNMTDGALSLTFDHDDNFPDIALTLPFSGTDFYYRNPMSPARDTQGIMTLNNKKLRFNMSDGTINNIDITNGYFEIPDIAAKIPMGKAQLFLDGRVSDLMQVLDQKPLNIMTPRHIDYKNKAGRFSGDVTFLLPLLSTVTFDDVKINGKVGVKNGSVSLQKKRYNITDYHGDIRFTESGLTSPFRAKVNTVSVTGSWSENFKKSAAISTDISAKGTITEKGLLKFGIDLTDYWQGSAKTDFKLQLKSGRITHISAKADASRSSFFIPYSTYHDKKGTEKTVMLSGKDTSRGLILDNITVKSNNTDLVIKNLIANNGLRSFDIQKLHAKDIVQNVTGTYRHIPNKRPALKLHASYLNAEKFINYDPQRPAPSAPLHAWTAIKTHISADSVRMSDKKTIKNIAFHAISPPNKPFEMHIDGSIDKSNPIKATIKTLSHNQKEFTLKATDAGAFLNAYDSFYYYDGGILNITGMITKKRQGVPATITGKAIVTGGSLENAPTVAKIFSVASMSGISDRLGRGNLSMDKIGADFTKKGAHITLKNGTIAGSAIGISFKGKYHAKTGETDISGTFVPLYGLNNLVSNIPILGDILTSRKEEGIIGMTYTMEGTFEDPNISVNPLSALTPGILRRIFE